MRTRLLTPRTTAIAPTLRPSRCTWKVVEDEGFVGTWLQGQLEQHPFASSMCAGVPLTFPITARTKRSRDLRWTSQQHQYRPHQVRDRFAASPLPDPMTHAPPLLPHRARESCEDAGHPVAIRRARPLRLLPVRRRSCTSNHPRCSRASLDNRSAFDGAVVQAHREPKKRAGRHGRDALADQRYRRAL